MAEIFERKSIEKKEEKKEISPELLAFQKKAEEFIDSYNPLFTTFAKDISLSFAPDLKAETFFIDLEKGKVNLATKWFAEQGYSMDQLIWACFHEVEHFKDLKSDKEAVLENFDYLKNKGRYRKAYHTFYNVFDDLFVNQGVANQAPAYTKDQIGGQEVERLYKEKLFKETDFQKLPRHLQFLYTLLRQKMVPLEKTKVSQEVKDVLEKEISVLGQKMDYSTFIETFIKPTATSSEKEENLPHRRYQLLKRYIEPIFEKLLEEDIEDPRFKPRKGQKGQPGKEGEGTPFDDFYKEFDKKNPSQIPQGKIEKWVRNEQKKEKEAKEKEKKEEEEEAKSPRKKAKEAQAAADQEFAKRNDIPLETMEEFRKLEAKVNPYLEELSSLWRSIIYGKSEEVRIALEGFYKHGTDIDIPEVVKEWPKIEMGRLEETRIFVKPVEKTVIHEKPELIQVHLLCDLSGSMDSEKREILKETTVLLLRSLEEFQTYLNMTRDLTKSKLNVETEAWGFGDREKAEKLKYFASEKQGRSLEAERAELIKTIAQLDRDKGSTYDDRPLEAIAQGIETTPGILENLKKGKILKIIIEITDGGSSDEEASRRALHRLTQYEEKEGIGVIVRAIQIKPSNEAEEKIFKEVWQEKGYPLGDRIYELPQAVATILAKYLGTLKL